MTLRTKTLLLISVTLLGLVAILYIASQIILVNSFTELEAYDARQHIERVLGILFDELARLDTVAQEWAVSDTIQAFTKAEAPNEADVETILTADNFTDLKLNFIVLVDSQGQMMAGKGFDLQAEHEIAIPPDMQKHLQPATSSLNYESPTDRIMGILPIEDGPLLTATRPIIDEAGEILGSVVASRYLNEVELKNLAETARLSLSLYRYNDPELPVDFIQARRKLAAGNPIAIQPLSAQTLGSYTLLESIDDTPVLILRVELPRNIWYQGQSSSAYFLASLVIVGVAFSAITLFLLEHFVLSRLARLDEEVGYIGTSSSFNARVSVVGHDELAHLAQTINQMLVALKQSQADLQQAHNELEQRVVERTQELAQANENLKSEIAERARAEAAEHEMRVFAEALSEVTAALTSTLELDEVLEGILANVGFVVPHDAANIMLIEEPGIAHVVYGRGYTSQSAETALLKRSYTIADTPSLNQMQTTNWPVIIPDIQTGPPTGLYEADWIRAYVGSPIILEAKVIGFINLDSSTPGFFTDKHAKRLRAFADHAAIALENARLHKEAQYLSVMDERGRLANELHDAVSQMLFSASLIADVLPALWERNPEMGQESLHDLRRLTRGALAEMRALLLEMRPHALEEAELHEMLDQLIRSIAGRTGVDIALTFDVQHTLPVDVRINLYRIAQEALNNVARHANADRVTVSLQNQAAGVALQIQDNGRGFNPDSKRPGHFGLGIMRERAESIGAGFEVNSRPGAGTQIEVIWQNTQVINND